MKRSFKIVFPACVIGVLFLVSGCSNKGYGTAVYAPASAGQYSSAQFSRSASPEMAYEAEYGAGRDGYDDLGETSPLLSDDSTLQARKLVKRAGLRIRADDLEATEKPLNELIEKYNAWTASIAIYDNSRDYSIRVPAFSYDAMLAELAGLGRILWHMENAEDVTLRYYDLEGRLATQQELLKTYQDYLGRAQNIGDIMTVESRIADLQREIDWTGTQFKNLANLVDYSTINLEILGPAGAPSYYEPSLGEKLGELFGAFGNVASSTLVVLMGIIIYGIPAVLILTLLFWLLFGRIGLIKRLWRLASKK